MSSALHEHSVMTFEDFGHERTNLVGLVKSRVLQWLNRTVQLVDVRMILILEVLQTGGRRQVCALGG